jgi:predicted GNAT family acetyltransferase
MSIMSATVADHPEATRYELTADDERIGFVTYRMEPGVIALLHAEVNPAHERQGWGSRLVAGALDDVRERGLKVRPVCPFVVAYIERHPDYRDLVA